MFGKNQTRWYIYTWVLFSTHVWILTHMYGKKHTCVKKATQLYICKCWAFSTHVWEKPLTCLFPPELSVKGGGANSLAAQCCGCIFQPYLYHCTWHAANPRSLLHQQQGKYYIKIISNIMSVSSVQFTDIICNVCHIFMPFFYLTFCDKFQTENVNTGICIGIYCK